jgi:rubrerythrin
MPRLKGSQTERNLLEAFAREAQNNRRFLYFARRADVEGHADVARLFRDVAEGETGHAFGHLEFLEETGDPMSGTLLSDVAATLRSAIESETHDQAQLYPSFAATAREEGMVEVAEWFELLVRAETAHLSALTRALEQLEGR